LVVCGVAENRRTSTRHVVSIAATLKVDGASQECTLVNLSLGGCLFSVSTRFAMGQRVDISFKVSTIDEAIDIGGIVRWSDDQATGVQFDGLRARDVWALNKFFEQLPRLA
jgi:hypothetical protein